MATAARRNRLRLAVAAAIVLAGGAVGVADAGADGTAQTIATEPFGLTARPVLWGGGVAWSNYRGIYAAMPGSAPRQLAKVPISAGFLTGYVLDSGSGTPDSSGALVYGWQEDNNMTPPMGPGDTKVPSPPIPYETGRWESGMIAADGQLTNLTGCPTVDPFANGATSSDPEEHFDVSISGTTLAYGCPFTGSPGFLAVANVATPATTSAMLPGFGNSFLLSGSFVAADTSNLQGAGEVAEESLADDAQVDLVAVPADSEPLQLALQSDGTLVVLGAGTASCPPAPKVAPGETSVAPAPAEWFAPLNATPHQLDCFYSGAPRPVGGEWIALAPDPDGSADLVAVDLASGTTRTLETFPNVGMFGGADYDGESLAWAEETCAGTLVELTADVAAMTPGPVPTTRCPVSFHVTGRLHPSTNGTVHVSVSCADGCDAFLTVTSPERFVNISSAYFALAAGSAPAVESLRLGPRQLRYLKAHGPLTIALEADQLGPGSASTRSRARVTLAR